MRYRNRIRRTTSILASLIIVAGLLAGAPVALAAPSASATVTATTVAAPRSDSGGLVTVGHVITYVTTITVDVQSSSLSQVSLSASHGGGTWTRTFGVVEAWAPRSASTTQCQDSSLTDAPYQCSLSALTGKGRYIYEVTTRFRPHEVTDTAVPYTLAFSYLEGQGSGTPSPKQTSARTSTTVTSDGDSTSTWVPPTGGTVETTQTISNSNRQATLVTVPDLTKLTPDTSSAPPSGYVVSLLEATPSNASEYCGPSREGDGIEGTAQCISEVSHVAVQCAVASECTAGENADDAGGFVFPDASPLYVRIKSLAPSGLLPPTIWHTGREVRVGDSTASCPTGKGSYLYDADDRGGAGDTVDTCSYRSVQTLGFDGLVPYVQFEIRGRKNGDYRS